MRIAVTGASGMIGRRLCPELATSHEIARIDRRGADFNLDIANFAALRPALDRCEAVIHLAAASATHSSWEDVQHSNIVGTYNVFEAARQAGCKRVIFASSHHAIGMYYRGYRWNVPPPGPDLKMLSTDLPPRPDSLYGVSKVFGEALGRYFCDAFGMQVACIRIASMNDVDKPVPSRSWLPWRRDIEWEKRMSAKWFSHRDFARLVRAILERNVEFSLIYAVGDNVGRVLDLTPGHDLYGFSPLDGAK
jgi:nucleoside-diphosphate-sugar epimerase